MRDLQFVYTYKCCIVSYRVDKKGKTKPLNESDESTGKRYRCIIFVVMEVVGRSPNHRIVRTTYLVQRPKTSMSLQRLSTSIS